MCTVMGVGLNALIEVISKGERSRFLESDCNPLLIVKQPAI